MISGNKTALIEPRVCEMRHFLDLKDIMLGGEFEIDEYSRRIFVSWGRKCVSAIQHLEKLEREK